MEGRVKLPAPRGARRSPRSGCSDPKNVARWTEIGRVADDVGALAPKTSRTGAEIGRVADDVGTLTSKTLRAGPKPAEWLTLWVLCGAGVEGHRHGHPTKRMHFVGWESPCSPALSRIQFDAPWWGNSG